MFYTKKKLILFFKFLKNLFKVVWFLVEYYFFLFYKVIVNLILKAICWLTLLSNLIMCDRFK